MFRQVFGDEAGLRCERLVGAARAAAAGVGSVAVPSPAVGEHLRRGRWRWQRARLYHLMRQVLSLSPHVHRPPMTPRCMFEPRPLLQQRFGTYVSSELPVVR